MPAISPPIFISPTPLFVKKGAAFMHQNYRLARPDHPEGGEAVDGLKRKKENYKPKDHSNPQGEREDIANLPFDMLSLDNQWPNISSTQSIIEALNLYNHKRPKGVPFQSFDLEWLSAMNHLRWELSAAHRSREAEAMKDYVELSPLMRKYDRETVRGVTDFISGEGTGIELHNLMWEDVDNSVVLVTNGRVQAEHDLQSGKLQIVSGEELLRQAAEEIAKLESKFISLRDPFHFLLVTRNFIDRALELVQKVKQVPENVTAVPTFEKFRQDLADSSTLIRDLNLTDSIPDPLFVYLERARAGMVPLEKIQ